MPSVIVDTSVWVDYLRGTQNARTDALDRLLENGEAAICGVIEAELVAGLRNRTEREELVSLLEGCDYLEVSRADWRRAGELAGQLKDRGRTLPLSDLIIAALAIDRGCALLASDSHFTHIPGARLFTL
jgi:predicted nucleic acid-binding protein